MVRKIGVTHCEVFQVALVGSAGADGHGLQEYFLMHLFQQLLEGIFRISVALLGKFKSLI